MKSFVEFFGCGKVNKRNNNVVDFVVRRISDIDNKIIPFFKNYRIIGVKFQDFED
jgi:hypothetical protein